MTSNELSAYDYSLPKERIAHHPLAQRDAARLLVYRQGQMVHSQFSDLATHLPSGAALIFNNTRVIPARLAFHNANDARIEIFLLEPAGQMPVEQAMASTKVVQWQAMVGNAKRWKEGETLTLQKDNHLLQARLSDKAAGIVSFHWNSGPFSDVLTALGDTPLPPYIPRPANTDDSVRYQTIYGQVKGAVAAPTAGLHFTDAVFDTLSAAGIQHDFVTLHVGAGTFLPIKSADIRAHTMHSEVIVIDKRTIAFLREHTQTIAVGTTSLRVLESLYWYGALLQQNPDADFNIPQQLPPFTTLPDRDTALALILDKMEQQGVNTLCGKTSLYVTPGYSFHMIHGLVTNFHQPKSSLLLLIAALIGKDWQRVYAEALGESYRFLSYGDSSLLLP